MATPNKFHLLLLLDRPLEPVFKKKGDNTVFVLPKEYYTEKYEFLSQTTDNWINEEGVERVEIKNVQVPPLGEVLDLPRESNFSLFIPKHQRIADRLVRILLTAKTFEDLLAFAAYVRDRVNPYLFNYALSVAILHRKDTRKLALPTMVYFFPDKFFQSGVFSEIREEITILPPELREPIEIPKDYSANDFELEHRLAYFREDVGLNLHHWHWHLVYPGSGERNVVAKDRRGELFYYMHQQIIARYNFERLCNKLSRVTRFLDWRKPIEEAYFPKLNSLVASRPYAARVANQKIQNLYRPDNDHYEDVDDMYRWRDRIYKAIHQGFVWDSEGNKIELTETEGIDILGNIIEKTELSVNGEYYGNVHNMGHLFIGYSHDPDYRHLEDYGVIGDSSTAMRDPIFYRWHACINDLFQEHKESLPRYSEERLNYPGVSITGVKIISKKGNENTFHTFWQKSDLNLSSGLDFQNRGPVHLRWTHLQHRPFVYNITVKNEGPARLGTCRIFLSPKFNEIGNPWTFEDQKDMMIEMDKFTVKLDEGQNTITRKSTDPSVTIPYDQTYRDLDACKRIKEDGTDDKFNFCGCGWPENLLVPKGFVAGLACELFVMISNYEHDDVSQNILDVCKESASYCGLRDKLYPDKRSMGYPFDRMPRDEVETLADFLTPNMFVQEVDILHEDITEQRPK